MIKDIDNFYLSMEEPARSCLMALRQIILSYSLDLTEEWKYRMPFFCYRKKMFCYLWVTKKARQPYIGVVEGRKITHPRLIQENRSRMKIMLIDPLSDLPVKTIYNIFNRVMPYYEE